VPLSNSIDDFPTVIPSLSPVISPPRLRNVQTNTDPARRIQQYVEKSVLVDDHRKKVFNFFSSNLDHEKRLDSGRDRTPAFKLKVCDAIH
jgi:hypothetical protein